MQMNQLAKGVMPVQSSTLKIASQQIMAFVDDARKEVCFHFFYSQPFYDHLEVLVA